ncbi:MAG: thiamine pyrophosphate-requiring protein [Ardenticatenaceae bacterium]|nr:thiamine pyrophosphate-requiring protein [Ardenticatenaceae bacterium]
MATQVRLERRLRTYLDQVEKSAAQASSPGAVERPARGQETRWLEIQADEVGDAIVQAMAVGGIEYLFFSSGSDIIWYQESIAKMQSLGRPAPKILAMLHESVSLSAATGYTMVSGRPAATAAHVELGTLNYGAAIHSAYRGSYPVLITAGKTPNTYGGTARGDRDQWGLWYQDLADYGSIVRQHVKWDHELHATDNPGMIVSRAIQVIMSEPRGPAYLSIPRDVALVPLNGSRFPTLVQLGIPETPGGDPDALREAARILVRAQNPLVISRKLGRNPAAVPEMVALAELLGLPFMDEGRRDRMNFPSTHPFYEGGPKLADADVILLIDGDVPWLPGYEEPSPEATIIALGLDPIESRYQLYEFPAHLRIVADAVKALPVLREEAEQLLTVAERRRIEERRERIVATSRARRQAIEREALSLSGQRPISPRYLGYQLGRILGEEAIMVDDAVGNTINVMRNHRTSVPNTYFRSGGASGGWGVGAALGAKLAAPDRDVVLASGDGFFLYGVPYAALWAARKYQAPFLSVVFQNLAYGTGTLGVKKFYPDGYAIREDNLEGGYIEPAPDLAKQAESVGAYGENVADPDQVGPALQRGLEAVRSGVPAVVAVRLLQLVRETQERW